MGYKPYAQEVLQLLARIEYLVHLTLVPFPSRGFTELRHASAITTLPAWSHGAVLS
jgi:hypothetical protein